MSPLTRLNHAKKGDRIWEMTIFEPAKGQQNGRQLAQIRSQMRINAQKRKENEKKT